MGERERMTNTFATKAAYYIDVLKWPVFPTNPATKAPCVKGGCHAGTTNSEIIQEWGSLYPNANVAVSTGRRPSWLVVVDIDGPEGEENWKKLVAKYLFQEPQCPQVLTSRGRHLYFTGNGVRNSCGVLGKGIDVKGEGGSATVPPSVHSSGAVYRWMDLPMGLPNVVRPAPFPSALYAILNQRANDWLRKYKITDKFDRPPDLERLVDMVRGSSQGERNHTLNRAAFLASKAVKAGAVSTSEALQSLSYAAAQAGLLRQEIQRTILSGLRGGAKKL
jgi:hypothetical protein